MSETKAIFHVRPSADMDTPVHDHLVAFTSTVTVEQHIVMEDPISPTQFQNLVATQGLATSTNFHNGAGARVLLGTEQLVGVVENQAEVDGTLIETNTYNWGDE